MRQSMIRLAFGRSSQKFVATEPRHLLSMKDVTDVELNVLVRNTLGRKWQLRNGSIPKTILDMLAGETIALMFSKRSTRTRLSTEAAITRLGGRSIFLGKDDIQMGVNESVQDTSTVISSMASGIVARVGPHSDVEQISKHSKVPVINGLSDDAHPLQAIADLATLREAFHRSPPYTGLGLDGLKLAWVGDSNNVLFDLARACIKSGVDIAVASPDGYGIPTAMRESILSASNGVTLPGKLSETTAPEEAVKNADAIVTDTWVSMGQEGDRQERLKAFEGFQVTEELAQRGGAKDHWKFMHCLPRHAEEVSDEVFHGSRSLVFQEAENRLWTAMAVFEAFFCKHGRISYNLQACRMRDIEKKVAKEALASTTSPEIVPPTSSTQDVAGVASVASPSGDTDGVASVSSPGNADRADVAA